MGDFNFDFNFDFTIMSKDEMIALIDAKIAGQGNQIDLAGVLADIRKAGGITTVQTKPTLARNGLAR